MTTKKNISFPEGLERGGYIPPRLVKAEQGWYIVYYHHMAGQWLRERKTFNLNRISDKQRRLKRAKELIQSIDQSLENRGGEESEFAALAQTPIIEAITFAAGILCQSPKKDTRKSFLMIGKMLSVFIEKKGWGRLTVSEFGSKHARAFLDGAIQRGISNTTFNNYRNFSGTMFNVLVNREYIAVNPFAKIKMMRREEKTRRAFTADERAVVLAEIYAKDYWLFVIVMLHRLLLLRRTECSRLRFNNFNLGEGYLHLPKSITKNGKPGTVTIPNVLRDLLAEDRFSGNPGNYLVFGAAGHPHPSQPAAENTYKLKHRNVLLRLKAGGKLADITGLSLYSWKDTGMTEFAKVLRPIELRDQARHVSIDQSLEYYHADKVSVPVKKASVKLLE